MSAFKQLDRLADYEPEVHETERKSKTPTGVRWNTDRREKDRTLPVDEAIRENEGRA